jgi:hypothetical protein
MLQRPTTRKAYVHIFDELDSFADAVISLVVRLAGIMLSREYMVDNDE